MAHTKGHSQADYLKLVAEMVAKHKQRTYELMEVSLGQRVLDVGCGPGTDTIPLAKIVGASGQVIGIDVSEQQIELAERRSVEAGVQNWTEHRLGDGSSLPFDANYFDSARSERVFQHTDAPIRLLNEMIRVTKAGGRIVVLDTDWSTMSVDTELIDIEQKIKRFHVEKGFRNGYSGRKLYRMFLESRLEGVSVEMAPTYVTDYQIGRRGALLDETEEAALVAGVISQKELDTWRRDLENSDSQGTYFAAGLQMMVVGRKPE